MRKAIHFVALMLGTAASALVVGCGGQRFFSADRELENIFGGMSYYEIVDEFGRPDVTLDDGMQGSRITYHSVSLNGTSAADLYRTYHVRNRSTEQDGMPYGSIAFSFKQDMRCYAVDSDFELERTEEPKGDNGPTYLPGDYRPKMPRTLDFPYVKSRSPYAEPVSIEQIELQPERTVVHFKYMQRTPSRQPKVVDHGVYVHPDVYMVDNRTGERYKLLDSENITFYPEHTHFAHNEGGYDVLVYSLTFEGLPAEAEDISIIEPGHSGYNFYHVDVKTPLIAK